MGSATRTRRLVLFIGKLVEKEHEESQSVVVIIENVTHASDKTDESPECPLYAKYSAHIVSHFARLKEERIRFRYFMNVEILPRNSENAIKGELQAK